jgi:hypothetical protein
MIMVVLHFLKREFETLFIHRFSADTMPLAYIVRNSAHYWALCGVIFGYIVNHPSFSSGHVNRTSTQTYITLLFYTFFELSNLYTHITLRRLRPEGTRARLVPRGYGFDWPFGGISFPNYFFDFMGWVVIAVWSFCWGILPFLAVAVFMMDRWSQQVCFSDNELCGLGIQELMRVETSEVSTGVSGLSEKEGHVPVYSMSWSAFVVVGRSLVPRPYSNLDQPRVGRIEDTVWVHGRMREVLNF